MNQFYSSSPQVTIINWTFSSKRSEDISRYVESSTEYQAFKYLLLNAHQKEQEKGYTERILQGFGTLLRTSSGQMTTLE